MAKLNDFCQHFDKDEKGKNQFREKIEYEITF